MQYYTITLIYPIFYAVLHHYPYFIPYSMQYYTITLIYPIFYVVLYNNPYVSNILCMITQ